MAWQHNAQLEDFRAHVLARGRELYRNLSWRQTYDPYAIWISEVMLQQTQVSRVEGRWQRWLERFPNVDALASASSADVLQEWQGLGYNRRALSLLKAAQQLSSRGSVFPSSQTELEALPGIGAATAAGIRAFAFNLYSVYLETNVRTVFLHELYPQAEAVPDKELVPLVAATCPRDASMPEDTPRIWYYALLDYGAYLKRSVPNPGRRSAGHGRQTPFEGSRRQKRANLVRLLLKNNEGVSLEELFVQLNELELEAKRTPVEMSLVEDLLQELEREGFCRCDNALWLV